MSTHTPPVPYPHLLGWFTGSTPDTAQITAELVAMAQREDFARLLSALRLHDEIGSFHSALQVAFPKLDLAAPHFPKSQHALGALASGQLKSVGASCLTAIALGTHEESFDTAHFTWNDTGLLYKDVPVFATVSGHRERVFVAGGGMLHITSNDHVLKGWLQRLGSDVTVQEIHGVAPDDHASGYNALEATDNLTWECSYGEFDTPEHLIQAITKSDAFGQIAWGGSYCTAGWVSSLMPTLSTRGTIRIPGTTVTIGQNVHSPTAVGSAWIEGMAGIDCKQDKFPKAWVDGVKAVLCPHAATNANHQNIVMFCTFLKQKPFVGKPKATQAEREERIAYLIAKYPQHKQTLRTLPNIEAYYPKLF